MYQYKLKTRLKMAEQKLTRKSAKGILGSRAFISKIGVMANMPVQNVTFINPNTSQPFQDDNWDDGKPYAIANFNAVNAYDRQQSMEQFKAGEYDLACRRTTSMRVSPKLGRALAEAQFASVVIAERTFTPKDSDEEVTVLQIKKATPIAPMDASETKAFKVDAFETEEVPANTGAPSETEA